MWCFFSAYARHRLHRDFGRWLYRCADSWWWHYRWITEDFWLYVWQQHRSKIVWEGRMKDERKEGTTVHTLRNVKYCKSIHAIFRDSIWIGRVRFWVCYTHLSFFFVHSYFAVFWLVKWALSCVLWHCVFSWFSACNKPTNIAKCCRINFFYFFFIILICLLMYRLATNKNAIIKSIGNPLMLGWHKVSYGDYVATAFVRVCNIGKNTHSDKIPQKISDESEREQEKMNRRTRNRIGSSKKKKQPHVMWWMSLSFMFVSPLKWV